MAAKNLPLIYTTRNSIISGPCGVSGSFLVTVKIEIRKPSLEGVGSFAALHKGINSNIFISLMHSLLPYDLLFDFCYSQLSLSRSLRDHLKHLEIPVLRHIR